MKRQPVVAHMRLSIYASSSRPACAWLAAALFVFVVTCAPVRAQDNKQTRPRKLPTPERIVADYLKTVGGKQKQSAIRDATYEWLVELSDGTQGRARTVRKAPDATRLDLYLGDAETNSAANARTAWRRERDGSVRTLTGGAAQTAKLQAALEASRLLDLKKRDVLARTVAYDDTAGAGEAAYIVEFARRDGARLRCRFGAQSKLLTEVADEAQQTLVAYADYRAEQGTLEPHRVRVNLRAAPALTFTLQSVSYNTNLSAALFEPPGDGALNVVALLREVARHQDVVERRVHEYTFTRRETEREFNDRGELKKEKTVVHEVYPLPGRRPVLKLISEDGVPLPPERAAREEKRVGEEIEEATRDYEKQRAKRARERAERERRQGDKPAAAKEEDDDEFGIGTFVRVCEFVAPRRERLQERDVIVFDFRARPGYKPKGRPNRS